MIKVAVVGAGIIGLHQLRQFVAHPSYEVTAIIEPVGELAARGVEACSAGRAAASGAADEVAVYETLDHALSVGGFDLISICTPSGMHAEQAAASIRAGLHTVIEKPLDVSLQRARHLLEVERNHTRPGQVISVISQHRFDPANRVIKQAVEEGRFGQLTSAVASMPWYRPQEYYDQGAWRGTWELDGGGAVMNQAVHTIDLLRWFLGAPIEVSAQAAILAHERIEVEDVLTGTIVFASGALAAVHATTAAFPGLSTRIAVHGTRGSGTVDRDQLEYFYSVADADNAEQDGARSTTEVADPANLAASMVPTEELRSSPLRSDAFAAGHLRQFDDIAQAITERRPPAITLSDAYASLALVLALYTSAALGRPIQLDDVLAGNYDDVAFDFPRRTGSS